MAVELCHHCKLPHYTAVEGAPGMWPTGCVEAQALAMTALLKNVGQQGLCRGCSAPGYWVTHYNGKATFYTPAGLNHFVDCPKGDRFKKGK